MGILLFATSFIALVFYICIYYFHLDGMNTKIDFDIDTNMNIIHNNNMKNTIKEEITTVALPSTVSGQRLAQQLSNLTPPFDFLQAILPQKTPTLLGSTVIDLRHCSLENIDFHQFTSWAHSILQEGYPRFQSKFINGQLKGLKDTDWNQYIVPELLLGLLEMYATHDESVCDFTKFNLDLRINESDTVHQIQKLRQTPQGPTHMARFAIVIIAFQDVEQLKQLVQALHMPHHIIIIHLERATPLDYINAVQRIVVDPYTNVILLQFSSVIYRTDSVSFINYQIMNWLIRNVRVKYDYHITLDGAAYPLYGNEELAIHLAKTTSIPRHIWLGEMTHDGHPVRAPQYGLLQTKRLMTTYPFKYTQRIKRSVSEKNHSFTPTLPDFITNNMMYKTNSGNQAVYSYQVVQQLVTSPHVKQLFATAKYGCCCCLEERTWVAAMFMIGHGDEALQRASMWQVWGGHVDCTSSMNNAVIHSNETACFRLEDATKGSMALNTTIRQVRDIRKKAKAVYIRGNQVMDALKDAKKRGFLFARKFRSDNDQSMALQNRINNEIHNKQQWNL